MTDKKEKVQEIVPLHKQKHLVWLKEAGYEYRWVNDLPGRVASFKIAGWELVEGDSAHSHDSLSIEVSQIGSYVRRVVNKSPNAANQYAYLMKIKTELFDAAQKDKLAEVEARERAVDPHNANAQAGWYGNMHISYK